jgi:hypothetical protein
MVKIERNLGAARKAMVTDGVLWGSWCKKSAKIPTDVMQDLAHAP